jgi:hypothetical protein
MWIPPTLKWRALENIDVDVEAPMNVGVFSTLATGT